MWVWNRADPRACASSPRLWRIENEPTEIQTGTGRWWWSPARRRYHPDRNPEIRSSIRAGRWRSTLAQNRRRYASREPRSHRRAWTWKRGHESPCGTAFLAPIANRLGCLPGFRDRSVARNSDTETDPSMKIRDSWNRLHNDLRIS